MNLESVEFCLRAPDLSDEAMVAIVRNDNRLREHLKPTVTIDGCDPPLADNTGRPAVGVVTGFGSVTDDASCRVTLIDAELRRFALEDAGDKTYVGLRADVQPDGAIMQVTWSVGGGSESNPSTRASRQSEHNLSVASYPQRRRLEDTRPILANLRVKNAIALGVKAATDLAKTFRKTSEPS